MTKHQWREQDGEEVCYWRANYHGGRFELFRKGEEDERWEKLTPPRKEDWEALRDVLWRKYQRKRCPWKLVAKVDAMIEKADAGSGE